MKKIFRLILFGFLTWLVPFLTAFFFYDKNGQVNIDIYLFKTIMMLIGNGLGAFLLVNYFKSVTGKYINQGFIIGFLWFGMNIILDVLILLPISHMDFGSYINQIGLRYLSIP